MTFEVRRYFQLGPDAPGVIVTGLEKGSSASIAGLRPYELILSVDGEEVLDAEGFGSVISVPQGGGAIKGLGETFKPNLFTGTANLSVPLATSPGRGGFGPGLSLQYSSGNGNGPFGLGWGLSVPQISRKTERGIPRYNQFPAPMDLATDPQAAITEDTFLLSGAEDLGTRREDGNSAYENPRREGDFLITTYRPRIEGLFARIERWQRQGK